MEALQCALLSSVCVGGFAKTDLFGWESGAVGFCSSSANELCPAGRSPSFPSTVKRRLELNDRLAPFLHLRINSRATHYDLGKTYSLLIRVHMDPGALETI